MKNSVFSHNKVTFVCLSVLLTLSAAINAQSVVQSGSFHCILPELARVEYTVNLEGPQRFNEKNVQGNLILSNLLPGEYMLEVTHGRTVKVKQMVRIDPARRVRFMLSNNGRISSEVSPDPNSIPLYTDSRREYQQPHLRPSPIPQPVSQAELDQIVKLVNKESFSDNKRRMLDVSTHPYPFFTTAQVEKLTRLFVFDDDKIFCLKLLVPKVIDTNNLPVLSSLFTHSSSKNKYFDLLKDLQQQR